MSEDTGWVKSGGFPPGTFQDPEPGRQDVTVVPGVASASGSVPIPDSEE
jgi:hypothetical protein